MAAPAPFDLLVRSPFWEWGAAVLGLIVGSFSNVCIHRLPRRESVTTPPSRCPGCGALIRPWDNVPLLSYLVLGGRCRACKRRISPRYPLVEAASGGLYWALAAAFGPSPRALVLMAFASALLILGLIDFEHQILPNAITLPGIVVGLLATRLPGWPVGTLQAAAAAAGGYLVFMLVAATYRKARGVEGLGQGDWKLAAMLGAFLGWQQLLLSVFLATLSGSLVGLGLIAFRGRDFQHALPFGTFLCAAGLLVLFVGDPLLGWYGGLFGL